MSDIYKTLKGINGQLEVYPDKIIIKRQGILAKVSQGFFKGDKTIYIDQISGIQVKKGSALINGYIQFTLSGGNENTRGIFDATKDENTIMFLKSSNVLVEEIKNYIESNKVHNKSNNNVSAAISPSDEIRKLKQLLDDGIISTEEFNKKKNQLLGI